MARIDYLTPRQLAQHYKSEMDWFWRYGFKWRDRIRATESYCGSRVRVRGLIERLKALRARLKAGVAPKRRTRKLPTGLCAIHPETERPTRTKKADLRRHW
jgi:hypothetical protein